jgi:hypothetical protein
VRCLLDVHRRYRIFSSNLLRACQFIFITLFEVSAKTLTVVRKIRNSSAARGCFHNKKKRTKIVNFVFKIESIFLKMNYYHLTTVSKSSVRMVLLLRIFLTHTLMSTLTAMRLDERLPLSFELKCSITCQLLFLAPSPAVAGRGLVLVVEGVETPLPFPISVSGSVHDLGCCFKLVHRRPQPRLKVLVSWKK